MLIEKEHGGSKAIARDIEFASFWHRKSLIESLLIKSE